MATFCATWNNHVFKEEYYGYKCKNCDLFFAYGCAPWEDDGEYALEDAGLLEEFEP